MRDPLPAPVHVAVVAAAVAYAFLFPYPGALAAGVDAVVLFLGALSVVPVIGWLKTVTFAPPAAAGVGGWAAATLLTRGNALPIATAGAAAAGALIGVLVVLPVRHRWREALPWSSLVALLVVSGFFLARVAAPGLMRPVFIGIDLSSPRALYLFGIILCAMSGAASLRLAGSSQGRLLATAGAAPDYAVRVGGRPDRLAVIAGAHCGAVAGLAGLVAALQQQGVPAAGTFSPPIALVWLGVAMVGGAGWTSGVVAGTLAVTTLVAVTPLPFTAVGTLALVVAVLVDRGVMGALPHIRRRPVAA